ncbi:MAG: helix-turn-helix transcriptional regulator [Polyangiaceae bacterium]|nr:helix-turn-helix transcriptional regulator [Polyangiaceae bacterium]
MSTNEATRAFGREVRRRRHAQGQTLNALAAGSGLSPNYIGGVERGIRKASLDSMQKLAAGLGTPLGELLGMPDMSPESIEAARCLTALPIEIREPIAGALRALAAWAGRQP